MSYFLKDEYRKFLEDIEKNIKNEEDLSYIKKDFLNLWKNSQKKWIQM